MNDYYVYCYIDEKYNEIYEINGKKYKGRPFYIGKGHGNRDRQHLSLYYKRPFYDKLRKMLKENNQPNIIRIEENLSEKDAYEKEIQYIAQFGIKDNNGILLNMNYGGEGGINPSYITRMKISLANKGKLIGEKNPRYGVNCKGENNWFYGCHHTEEAKKKMRRKYYIMNLENEIIQKVDNLQQWCIDNKCVLSCMSEITNKPMKYKNYVVLKDKGYNENFINEYFSFIKNNKKLLIGRSNKGKKPIEFSESIKQILYE